MTHTNKDTKLIPPIDWPNSPEHRRQIALAVHGLFDGKSNNIGEITLADSTTTTNIDDKRIGPESAILLAPLTANAAAISWHISARTNDQATITHDNTANADQDFIYIIVGG